MSGSRRTKKVNPIKLRGSQGPRTMGERVVNLRENLSPELAKQLLENPIIAKRVSKLVNIPFATINTKAKRRLTK